MAWGACASLLLSTGTQSHALQIIIMIWREFDSNRKLLLIEYNILMGVFGYFWSRLEAEGCGLGKVRQAAIRGYCHRSLDQCNARPRSFGLGRPIQKHVYQLARVCSGLPHICINCRSVVLGKLISIINYWNCLKLRVQYSFLINSSKLFCRQEFLNSDGKRLTILDFSTCEGG